MQVLDLQASMQVARLAVDQAGELLVNPAIQNLEGCLEVLGKAAERLAVCREALPGHAGGSGLLREADLLQQALHRAGFLLKTSSDYHMQWFRILRATVGGYTAEGGPAEVCCPARLCIQG